MRVFTAGSLTACFRGMLAAWPIVHRWHVTSLRSRFDNASLVRRLSEANKTADDAIARLNDQLEDQKRVEQALQAKEVRWSDGGGGRDGE